ncbi:MAG: tetratricopeptide repeat protein [Deltaproteobacteria bacterium]
MKQKITQSKISFWKKISLVLLGVVFSIFILELGLRLGGLIFTSLQKNTDSRSLFKKDSYRIMCLGESTTANQYPPFLEEILNKRNIGVKFSVIDKGKGGINTISILFNLEKNLDTYKPDMVITMMGNNDRGISYYKDIPEANVGLFQHFSAYRFIRLIFMHVAHKLRNEDIYGLDRAGTKRITESKETPAVAENDQVYIELGKLYQRQGKLPEAEESFKNAIDFNPENDHAYIGLGKLYREQDRLLEAEKLFKKARVVNPENDWIYVWLGDLYRQQDKFPEAEESLKKAIALNPENKSTYNELGDLYRQQGRFPEAEESFKKAVTLNPKNEWLYIQLGELYRQQGRFPEAEESLKKAITLNPEDDEPYIGLGKLYRQQGRFPEAEESFKKAITLNPKKDGGFRALGSLYREMHRIELAEKYDKRASYMYCHLTVDNYHRLKAILDKRGIRLICVQYPMLSVEPLKKIFEGGRGMIFVDNERIFKEAIAQASYGEYFYDMFAGDFGHCTPKGNRLLAKNIADVILEEVFGKR